MGSVPQPVLLVITPFEKRSTVLVALCAQSTVCNRQRLDIMHPIDIIHPVKLEGKPFGCGLLNGLTNGCRINESDSDFRFLRSKVLGTSSLSWNRIASKLPRTSIRWKWLCIDEYFRISNERFETVNCFVGETDLQILTSDDEQSSPHGKSGRRNTSKEYGQQSVRRPWACCKGASCLIHPTALWIAGGMQVLT